MFAALSPAVAIPGVLDLHARGFGANALMEWGANTMPTPLAKTGLVTLVGSKG
jgi:hypothetical protein